MPMPLRNGPQSGPQSGPRTNAPQPPAPTPEERNATLSAWLDEVIANNGVTADATEMERLEHASEHLTEAVAAGGTELAPDQARALGSVARSLFQVEANGDRAVRGGDGEYPTLLGRAEHQLEEFLEHRGAFLSDEALSRLTGALTTLETVYADGTVSAAEQAAVGDAADAVQGVLNDDFVKLSDAGVQEMLAQAADIGTLATTGFLALDADQWLAVNGANAALDALLAGTGSEEAVHDALAALRGELPAPIIGLANPAPGGHMPHAALELFQS